MSICWSLFCLLGLLETPLSVCLPVSPLTKTNPFPTWTCVTIIQDPQVRLRSCLEELAVNCIKYVTVTRNAIVTGHGSGKTKLDKERIKLCVREIDTLGNMARNLRALVTKSSMRERYKTGQNYLQKLKFLIDDVS